MKIMIVVTVYRPKATSTEKQQESKAVPFDCSFDLAYHSQVLLHDETLVINMRKADLFSTCMLF